MDNLKLGMNVKGMMFAYGLAICFTSSEAISQGEELKEHILFYSSFDKGLSADFAIGDASIYTAESYGRTAEAKPGLHNPDVILALGKGFSGDALHFKKQNSTAIYYTGSRNLGYSGESWSGSLSFWLRLDPEKDLAPGYCDPICITDQQYDDAAIWVDFTDHNPRKFRLGVIGDREVWNAIDKNAEDEFEKRTVTVRQPPFEGDKWTHIVITYAQVNTSNSICKLYLDGQKHGEVKDINDPFTWIEGNAKIMLGLGYIGMMDELTVFDKTLDDEEVKYIFGLQGGLKRLLE